MDDGRGRLREQAAGLDGAIAELVKDDFVAGWFAIRVVSFRGISLMRQVGCWLLLTWANGRIDFEEDYPPFAVLPELLAGIHYLRLATEQHHPLG